jgi:adenylate kinase
VGKTAVSQYLASKLNAIHVDLSKLVKQERLISEVDRVRETLIVDMKKVSERVQDIIKSYEQDVIIDGHYSMSVLPAKDVYLAFVLRRDPKELKEIMEDRGFSERKLWENLAAEILDVCLWDAVRVGGASKVCEIDASNKTIEEVAEEIVAVLEEKRKCRVGIVDWLGKLEKEGRLDEFLKDF